MRLIANELIANDLAPYYIGYRGLLTIKTYVNINIQYEVRTTLFFMIIQKLTNHRRTLLPLEYDLSPPRRTNDPQSTPSNLILLCHQIKFTLSLHSPPLTLYLPYFQSDSLPLHSLTLHTLPFSYHHTLPIYLPSTPLTLPPFLTFQSLPLPLRLPSLPFLHTLNSHLPPFPPLSLP